jgi:RNA polymerase sigma factor (sigma-70 family)
MPEADIAALYQTDLQEFNSDRRYEEHDLVRLDDCEPLVAQEDGCHSRLWWVEEIDNAALAKRLKSLSEADLELLTLYAFDEFGQAEIAGKLGISQAAVSKKLARLKKFLNIFASGL